MRVRTRRRELLLARDIQTASVRGSQPLAVAPECTTQKPCNKRRSTHAHVPSIALPDVYLSTPRMREMRAHIYASCMRACSCPCSSCSVSPARKLAKPQFFPTLHSFNVVLARPHSRSIWRRRRGGHNLTMRTTRTRIRSDAPGFEGSNFKFILYLFVLVFVLQFIAEPTCAETRKEKCYGNTRAPVTGQCVRPTCGKNAYPCKCMR